MQLTYCGLDYLEGLITAMSDLQIHQKEAAENRLRAAGAVVCILEEKRLCIVVGVCLLLSLLLSFGAVVVCTCCRVVSYNTSTKHRIFTEQYQVRQQNDVIKK